jgi:ABC-2 type transport system ATP-binding protein
VPDRTELPRWMRVEDHLRLLEPFYPTWDRAEAARLVELFALDPRARYEDLSRGQRALENLVAALAHRPPLLLLDEPFSGLDPGARRRVFEGVLEHLREERRTVLLVSHSLVDVERCADRVAVLQGGRIVLEGDLEDVRRRAVRVVVTLAEGEEPWTPPGRPLVEDSGPETTLFYLDFDADLRRALESDPRVRGVELAARDLEDVVVAASKQEVAA